MTQATIVRANHQASDGWLCLKCNETGIFIVDGEQHAKAKQHPVRIEKHETYVFQPSV